ncbi:hypothetical protein GF406_23455 [candidate division KSB1 bacterium]|jgi:DNA-binding NtrC family response regulator|nr:hypothetical protein [candidate division KSB1 bacterium]
MTNSITKELRLLGKSPEIARVRKAIKAAAKVDNPVLLVGEPGSDKRFIAEHIHMLSERADGPFVIIPCGAIGDTISPEKALGDKQNLDNSMFFSAQGGTLYLERVDKMSSEMQDRLYNIIDYVESFDEKKFDTRIIASVRPLSDDEEVPDVTHLKDELMQRFARIRIHIPPLRDRKQDIPFLLTQYLEEMSAEYGKSMPTIPLEVHEACLVHSWPGNVEELRNAVRNMVIMSPEGDLSAKHLPFFVKPNPLDFMAGMDLPSAVAEVEQYLIRRALAKYEGNQSKAARLLQVSEAALRYKMKKYGLPSAR